MSTIAMSSSDDGLHENCGVFGIYGHPKAAEQVYLGLYALQHRGQESSGIAASDGHSIREHKGMGLVASVFSQPGVMDSLKGHSAIGHNRYSTTGCSDILNAQPITIQFKVGQIAAAHNGNLVNTAELRQSMEQDGSIFQTTTDSEIVLHLIARSSEKTLLSMMIEALDWLEGAFCFVFLTDKQLIAVRDPHGFRPLCLGKLGDAIVVASESCALDIIRAEYIRSIEPGEIIVADENGMASYTLPTTRRRASCIFEYIYFARPDSVVFGHKVDRARRELGRQLAREAPCEADIVISVPDSANTAALGYSEASGIRFEIGLIRNHYVGRTFIAPHQHERDLDVLVKFNPVSGVLHNKKVVVVEDSIVRGTTLRQLIRLIRSGGAAEVHVRVSSPPIRFPCYYGIDMSTREELIASNHSVEEIREFIGADSLAYLSIDGMLRAVSEPDCQCTCCFSGDYPAAIPKHFPEKEAFDVQRRGAR